MLFIVEQYSIIYLLHFFFINLSFDKHWGYLHILNFANDVIMIFWRGNVFKGSGFIYFGDPCTSRIARLYIKFLVGIKLSIYKACCKYH